MTVSRYFVDTSALIALVQREDGGDALREALIAESGAIPTPVVVEFHRVISRKASVPVVAARAFLDGVIDAGAIVLPFDAAMAEEAAAANRQFGIGLGGSLNLLDLMVYGVAKVTGLPILCTGKDFAATDALIHPASRLS